MKTTMTDTEFRRVIGLICKVDKLGPYDLPGAIKLLVVGKFDFVASVQGAIQGLRDEGLI